MTHDLADDGFHEIHLSGKQLVFLFMATTVVSVIIFLCGVLVGRGVPVRLAQDSLVDPTPATTAGAPAPAPTPATAPAAADAGPIAAEAPAPTDDVPLSYKSRLESEAATKESLKRPAAAAPATAARSTPAPTPAAEPPTAPVRPGAWVVQVHALRDRAVANRIVQRLSGKGYPAFLVASGPPTGTYKVQVGRFKDRDEAVKVVERLKKEEQFNPWITR